MAQKLLNGSNIVSVFEQMGREAMPQGMATGISINLRIANCCLYSTLDMIGVQVMTPRFTCPRIAGEFQRGENILPGP